MSLQEEDMNKIRTGLIFTDMKDMIEKNKKGSFGVA